MMIFLYFLVFLSLYTFSYHFLDRIKNHPPSPFPVLPLIGHFYLFKKPLHRALSKISNRYGPVLLLRFGFLPVLLLSSPSAAEECLGENDAVFANRPRLLAGKHLGYNHTNLVWAPYGDHWRNHLRILTLEILSSSRIEMLSHILTDEIRSLMRRLTRSRNQMVELKSMFFQPMLNVTMRTIAEKRYYGESVGDVEETRRFQEMVTATLRLGGTTNISDFLPGLRSVLNGYEKSLIEFKEKRDEFMQRLIEENRKILSSALSKEKSKNMLEVLSSLQQ